MNYSRTRSLVGFISITACAMTMMAMSYVTTTWTGNDRYGGPAMFSMSLERHFNNALAAFDHLEVAAPMRHADDIVAPERQSIADALFASTSQPGQDWRFAVDTYRHIDPGRRLAV